MIEKGELTVVKANQFVQEYKMDLSLAEIRIVNYLIANIDSPKYDKEFRKFKLDIKEFSSVVYPDKKPGEVYKWIPEVIKNLSDKSAWREIDDEGRPGKTKKVLLRWIERPEFGEGYVELELNPYLAPYLLQLDKAFFKSKFQYTVLAQSKYTIPLYELLKSWEMVKNGEKTFEIEELRLYMAATKKSQQNFAEFKRTALEVAIKEINEITDLLVSYEEIKRGRKITHIKFSIKNKYTSYSIEDGSESEVPDGSEPSEDGSEGSYSDSEATILSVLKPEFARIADKYPILETEILDLYDIILRRVNIGLSIEDKDEEYRNQLVRDILRDLINKSIGTDIKTSLYSYLKGILKKDEGYWESLITRINDQEASAKRRSDALRELEASYARAEAEKEEQRKAYEAKKRSETI